LDEDSLDLGDGGKYFVYVEAWRKTHELEHNLSSIYTKFCAYLWRYELEELDS
jgi:hypothetical protein